MVDAKKSIVWTWWTLSWYMYLESVMLCKAPFCWSLSRHWAFAGLSCDSGMSCGHWTTVVAPHHRYRLVCLTSIIRWMKYPDGSGDGWNSIRIKAFYRHTGRQHAHVLLGWTNPKGCMEHFEVKNAEHKREFMFSFMRAKWRNSEKSWETQQILPAEVLLS